MLAGVTWWQIAQSWLTWWPRKTRAIWLRLRPSWVIWVPNTHNIHPWKIQMEHTKMEVCFTFFFLKHIFFIGWFFRFHLNFQGGITPNFQVESEIWSIPHRFSSRFFSLWGAPKRPFRLARFGGGRVAEDLCASSGTNSTDRSGGANFFLGSEAYPNFSHNWGGGNSLFFFSWCSKNVSISSWWQLTYFRGEWSNLTTVLFSSPGMILQVLGGGNSHIFVIFTPKIGGRWTHDKHIFQRGWVQPPTR